MNVKVSEREIEREINDSIKQERLDAQKADHHKYEFITDLKYGLGDKMKVNPSLVEVIQPKKPTRWERFVKFFNRF